MRSHAFPGNVRELEHWVEGAVALAPDGRIVLANLPVRRGDRPSGAVATEGALSIPLGLSLDDATRVYVEASVTAAGGNKSEAAKRLAIGRNTLARWLK
jgi:DNA-binding NtrC family response regulator